MLPCSQQIYIWHFWGVMLDGLILRSSKNRTTVLCSYCRGRTRTKEYQNAQRNLKRSKYICIIGHKKNQFRLYTYHAKILTQLMSIQRVVEVTLPRMLRCELLSYFPSLFSEKALKSILERAEITIYSRTHSEGTQAMN